MKKLLSISAALMLLTVFVAGDLCYAAAQKGKTGKGKTSGEGRAKKSVLDGCNTLIAEEKFEEGVEFTEEQYTQWRLAYGREASGDKNWTISPDMIKRELASTEEIMGVITETTGNRLRSDRVYRVNVTVPTVPVGSTNKMRTLDLVFQQEEGLPSVAKTDGKRPGENIGLNSYDLRVEIKGGKEVPIGDDERFLMGRLTGQELLTGQTIAVAPSTILKSKEENSLIGERYENVVSLSERHIVGNDALAPEILQDKIKDVRPNGNKLAIATTRKIELNEEGEFMNKEDEAYVLSILQALYPQELERATDLVKSKVIVFSYIPSLDMLAEIEAMTRATESTTNNLRPSTARALVDNV